MAIEYSINEVAKVFNFSPSWIRFREIDGLFRFKDGTLIEPKRTKPPSDSGHGDRRYTTRDMYYMAQSLERYGKITTDHMNAILDVVRALKRVNKYPIRKKK